MTKFDFNTREETQETKALPFHRDIWSLVGRASDLAGMAKEHLGEPIPLATIVSGIGTHLSLALLEFERQNRVEENRKTFDQGKVSTLATKLKTLREKVLRGPSGITEIYDFIDHAIESENPLVMRAAIAGVEALFGELSAGKAA